MTVKPDDQNPTPPTDADKEPVKNDTPLTDALQDITSTMPPISQHVVNQSQEPQPTVTTNNAGEPVADGKKKRGRPSKNPQQTQSTAKPTTSRIGAAGNSPPPPPQLDPMMTKATEAMTNLIQISGIMAAGESGIMKDVERVTVKQCWEDYFTAKGVIDLPPSMALAIGLSGYYFRIFQTPPAKAKAALGVAWLRDKFASLKKKKPKNAPHPDNRDDDVGKNDAR